MFVGDDRNMPATKSADMQLSKAIRLYWLDKKLSFSSRTIKTYTHTFNHLIAYTGDAYIGAITRADILGFVDWLRTERKLSQRSAHDSLARLSSLWSWASNELGIEHIVKGVKVKYSETIVDPLTQNEVKRLVLACDKTRNKARRATALLDRAIILILVDTGIRASELCALTVGDLDEKTGRLTIRHGKGDKPRIVILGARARKALYRYLVTRDAARPTDPLFATRENTHLHRDNLRHKLNSIADVAGVENVHPHRFRHTFAITFLRNGGDVLTLQHLLGHSRLEMVRHYARIAEQDIDAASKHSVADNWRL